MDQKFLLFVDEENDIAMYPLSSLISITCAADEAIVLNFKNSLGGNATEDKRDFVTLTTTAGAALEAPVMKEIARKIHATGPGYSDGVITVCDDIDAVFLQKDILSCAITYNA